MLTTRRGPVYVCEKQGNITFVSSIALKAMTTTPLVAARHCCNDHTPSNTASLTMPVHDERGEDSQHAWAAVRIVLFGAGQRWI